MKFKVIAQTAIIEWKEGASIKVRRLTEKQRSDIFNECDKQGITNKQVITDMMIEATIEGWEEIINEATDKPLEFNDDTRHQIFNSIKGDRETLVKLLIFVSGPLGNLKTGSTARSNTNGTSPSASNAREQGTEGAAPATMDSNANTALEAE
jgi:hypothetical protein